MLSARGTGARGSDAAAFVGRDAALARLRAALVAAPEHRRLRCVVLDDRYNNDLLVRVTVPRRVKVTAALSARLPRAGRARTLARGTRMARGATTVRLRLAPGRAAARKLRIALRGKRGVTAVLRVTTSPAGGSATTKRLKLVIRK